MILQSWNLPFGEFYFVHIFITKELSRVFHSNPVRCFVLRWVETWQKRIHECNCASRLRLWRGLGKALYKHAAWKIVMKRKHTTSAKISTKANLQHFQALSLVRFYHVVMDRDGQMIANNMQNWSNLNLLRSSSNISDKHPGFISLALFKNDLLLLSSSTDRTITSWTSRVDISLIFIDFHLHRNRRHF